ncbi:MAG: serine/threonine-protein kinase [Planctomycetia bacterium]|nr:serine/threonine-protein kinase [Planctomycetia bacterium]
MNSPTNDNTPVEPIIIRENIDSLSASLSDQIEMLAGELRTRWKSGKRVGVEQLGTAFAQLSRNEEQLLDLIYHEVLIREEFGEKPKLEDFATRFPQHVDRLQRLFAVHGAIEDDGWDEELDSVFADDAVTLMREESGRDSAPSSTEDGEVGDDGNARKRVHWPRKFHDSRAVEPPPGYELLEEIGRGGMAVVFRAKQQILNRIVALKMLLAGGVASKEVLARVQQEARAVAQLQHPGIVQIHEVGEHRGLPYLSLEYVAGGTLHEWLEGRPLPPLEAARVIEQLARTTQYAHERGIVHRDLKPANVLLTERPPSLQSSATIPISKGPQNGTPARRASQGSASSSGLSLLIVRKFSSNS